MFSVCVLLVTTEYDTIVAVLVRTNTGLGFSISGGIGCNPRYRVDNEVSQETTHAQTSRLGLLYEGIARLHL